VRQLGGSLGIAILQFMQTRYQDGAYAALATGVTAGNAKDAQFLSHLGGKALQLYQMVMTNATVLSYDAVLRLCAIVFVFSIPLVLLLKARKNAANGAPAPAMAE